MKDEEVLAYAKWLAEKHRGLDVEYISIFEMWEEYKDFDDSVEVISDKDAEKVDKLLINATIEVTWP